MANRRNSSFTRAQLSTAFHPLAALIASPSHRGALDGAAFWTLLLETLRFARTTQTEDTRPDRQHNDSTNTQSTRESDPRAANTASAPNVETLRRDIQQQELKLAADHA